MSTNPTFNENEIKLLLTTTLQLRSLLFDCIRFDVDPHSLGAGQDKNAWVGKRSQFPYLKDVEKCLAVLRVHTNSEEAVKLYEAMGFYDKDHKDFFK